MTLSPAPVPGLTQEWVLVPKEATPEMADGARHFLEPCTIEIGKAAWRAFLRASPAPPAGRKALEHAAERLADQMEFILKMSPEIWVDDLDKDIAEVRAALAAGGAA